MVCSSCSSCSPPSCSEATPEAPLPLQLLLLPLLLPLLLLLLLPLLLLPLLLPLLLLPAAAPFAALSLHLAGAPAAARRGLRRRRRWKMPVAVAARRARRGRPPARRRRGGVCSARERQSSLFFRAVFRRACSLRHRRESIAFAGGGRGTRVPRAFLLCCCCCGSFVSPCRVLGPDISVFVPLWAASSCNRSYCLCFPLIVIHFGLVAFCSFGQPCQLDFVRSLVYLLCSMVRRRVDTEGYSRVVCFCDLGVDFLPFLRVVLGCVSFAPYVVHSLRYDFSDFQGKFVGF